MKKLVIATLIGVLLLGSLGLLAGCGGSKDSGGDSAATGIVGSWKLDSVEVAGQKVDAAQLGAYQYSYTFKDDTNASIDVAGTSYDTSYTFKDNEVSFGEAALAQMTLKLVDGKLVLEEPTSGATMTFKKN